MGGCNGKAKHAKKQRKLQKRVIPSNLHTTDAQFQYMINESISKYLWDQQVEYESYIEELVNSCKIRKYMEYFSCFKNLSRFIKPAEQFYKVIIICCQLESKWNDVDRQHATLAFIFLVSLYHIEKFRIIHAKSDKKWWEGSYSEAILAHFNIVDSQDVVNDVVKAFQQYFEDRLVDIRPQGEHRVQDEAKILQQCEKYLIGLYDDCIQILAESDEIPIALIDDKVNQYTVHEQYQ